mmetsp:Transcript_26218/g.61609  ORF Transcript_26218/g.61609 Transcript_26218/m.61609 type:complete len:377 (+) Transcript_26218:71-1201(+)
MKPFSTISLLALGLFSSTVLGDDEECKTLEEIACGTTEHGAFSIFCQLMYTDFPQMGLDLKLDGSTWTVFMPTDEAFQTYQSVLEPIFQERSNLFWQSDFAGLNIIAYHFHNDYAYYSSDLYCKQLLTMSTGETSRHKCDAGFRYQKGQGNHDEDSGLPFPKIIETDIEFCNGVVHVLDGIMLPKNYDQESGIDLFDDDDDRNAAVVDGFVTVGGIFPIVGAGADDDEGGSDDATVEDELHSISDLVQQEECVVPEAVYAVVNKFKIRMDENCIDDWKAASNNNAKGARMSEPGALRFDIIGVTETDYILYELYKDEVAYYDGHLFTEHFQNWYQVRQRCVIEEESVFAKQYVDNTYDDSTFFSPFCSTEINVNRL